MFVCMYAFTCFACMYGLCNESFYGECVRQFNVGIREHIRISPLTKKKVKLVGSTVSDHLFLCNHSPSFESFNMFTRENRTFVLELKEILLDN